MYSVLYVAFLFYMNDLARNITRVDLISTQFLLLSGYNIIFSDCCFFKVYLSRVNVPLSLLPVLVAALIRPRLKLFFSLVFM